VRTLALRDGELRKVAGAVRLLVLLVVERPGGFSRRRDGQARAVGCQLTSQAVVSVCGQVG
jgi:hypothetical protein